MLDTRILYRYVQYIRCVRTVGVCIAICIKYSVRSYEGFTTDT